MTFFDLIRFQVFAPIAEAAAPNAPNKNVPTVKPAETEQPNFDDSAFQFGEDNQQQQPDDQQEMQNDAEYGMNANAAGLQLPPITPASLIRAINSLPADLLEQYKHEMANMAENTKNIPALGQLFSSINSLFQNQDVTQSMAANFNQVRQTAGQVGRFIEQLPGARTLNSWNNIGMHAIGNGYKRGGEFASAGIDGLKALRQPMRSFSDTFLKPLPIFGNIFSTVDEAVDNTLDDFQDGIARNSRSVGTAFKRPSSRSSNSRYNNRYQ